MFFITLYFMHEDFLNYDIYGAFHAKSTELFFDGIKK